MRMAARLYPSWEGAGQKATRPPMLVNDGRFGTERVADSRLRIVYARPR